MLMGLQMDEGMVLAADAALAEGAVMISKARSTAASWECPARSSSVTISSMCRYSVGITLIKACSMSEKQYRSLMPRGLAVYLTCSSMSERMRRVRSVRPLERERLRVHAAGKRAVLVVDVGDAARHAGAEVVPDLAEDERDTARHVLAAMCAHTLDDHGRTRVPHGEALAGKAVYKAATARRAHERDVAHDDVLVELEGRALWGCHGQDASREALAKVVVRVAAHAERHAAGNECAEALARRAVHRTVMEPSGSRWGAHW